MTVARGPKVALRRAAIADRTRIYEWLIGSDLTAQLLGPLFPDRPVPTPDDFAASFSDHFFDGSRPYAGRMFVISVDDGDIGCVSHGPIDLVNDVVEFDIWLAERRSTGRGYGSEALVVLADWLQASYGVNRFLVRPSRRNVKALRAMRRAGFRETDLPAPDVASKLALRQGTYADELLLFRILPVPSPPQLSPGRTYVFIDSEFTHFKDPQLISIGAVATDSTAFYAELEGWRPDGASEFVKDVVVPLLDGDAVPLQMGAEALLAWLVDRANNLPTVVISDSGFDRWMLAELFGKEDLPNGVQWKRFPVSYERMDAVSGELGLRRHHALDDARVLRHIVMQA